MNNINKKQGMVVVIAVVIIAALVAGLGFWWYKYSKSVEYSSDTVTTKQADTTDQLDAELSAVAKFDNSDDLGDIDNEF